MATKIEWAEETWNAVPGFDDYFVTISGEIRGPSGKIMKQIPMASGHLYVLCNRGRGHQRKLFVHRAVLLAYVGPSPPGCETRHLDGNPTNNVLSNLRWGTRMENVQDRRQHGRMPIPHESSFTKLTPADIPEIFRLHKAGLSSRAIGGRFGTSHTTILKILRGNRWKGYRNDR